jgi:hypothetical protein
LALAFPQRLSLNLKKVFWFFFSKKNRFLRRLPSVEAISIPGQSKKEAKNFCEWPNAEGCG